MVTIPVPTLTPRFADDYCIDRTEVSQAQYADFLGQFVVIHEPVFVPGPVLASPGTGGMP